MHSAWRFLFKLYHFWPWNAKFRVCWCRSANLIYLPPYWSVLQNLQRRLAKNQFFEHFIVFEWSQTTASTSTLYCVFELSRSQYITLLYPPPPTRCKGLLQQLFFFWAVKRKVYINFVYSTVYDNWLVFTGHYEITLATFNLLCLIYVILQTNRNRVICSPSQSKKRCAEILWWIPWKNWVSKLVRKNLYN